MKLNGNAHLLWFPDGSFSSNAHEHHMKTKALEAKTMDRLQALDEEISQSNKRLSELRERKRVLVQSKLGF